MANVVADTVRNAYTALRVDAQRILRLALVPSFLIVAADLLPAINTLSSVATRVLSFVAYAVLAIGIHRHILLPDVEKRLFPRPMVLFIFSTWIAFISLIGLAFLAPVMLLGAPSKFLLPLVLIPSFYLSSRASLVLPDRALGHSTPLNDIWRWSFGNGWKLTAVLFLPPFLMNVLMGLVTLGADKELRQLVKAIASIPVLIFEVALLSCAYRDLKKLNHAA
jgi:hypothetical protein